jgi:uncharacterized membrane protein HdeD (DUF308 family)
MIEINAKAAGLIFTIIGIYIIFEGIGSISGSPDRKPITQVGRTVRVISGIIVLFIGTFMLMDKPIRFRRSNISA